LPSDFLLIHLVTDRAITTADDFAVHAGFSSAMVLNPIVVSLLTTEQ
jgi:hypothetical protein